MGCRGHFGPQAEISVYVEFVNGRLAYESFYQRPVP